MTAIFAAVLTVSGAAREVSPSGTPATAFPKPDRPVADIISPIWNDEKKRDEAGEPGQLVRLLGIKRGMTIADIGAGSGYYVVRLSPMVGPKGRIIAEDVMPEYLQDLRKRVRDLGLHNVTVTLGEPHDPTLPTGSVDIAILVHMYHEVTQPYGLVYNLVPALKRGARVGIVDAFARTSEHGTPPTLLRCELAAVGYREISFDRLEGSDAYLAIFAPPSVATRPRPETIVACKRHSERHGGEGGVFFAPESPGSNARLRSCRTPPRPSKAGLLLAAESLARLSRCERGLRPARFHAGICLDQKDKGGANVQVDPLRGTASFLRSDSGRSGRHMR